MVEFPVDPPLSKMLILSEQYNCSAEILTIISMLSIPTIFSTPKGREQEASAAREKFFVPESDHLTLLNAFNEWERHDYSSEYAEKHFMHIKAL